MADELPISVNSMDDDALKLFVNSPSQYLKGIPREVVPSPFSEATKFRIENLLAPEGLSQSDIAKRIDLVAMVKVTNIQIID